MTSITNFGHTGPYRDYEATEDVIVAMSSLLCRSGVPELPPLLPPGSIGFDCAGVLGAMATMLALLATGPDGPRPVGGPVGARGAGAIHRLGSRRGERCGGPWDALPRGRVGSGSYGIYPFADGMVRLIILQTAEWLAVRQWLGDPEELRYLDLGDMAARNALLPPLLQKFFGDRTMLDLTEEAQSRKIAVTPVLPPQRVLDSPHFRQRQAIINGDVTRSVSSPVVSGMFRFDGERAGFRQGARPVGRIRAAEHEWAEAPVDLLDDDAASSLVASSGWPADHRHGPGRCRGRNHPPVRRVRSGCDQARGSVAAGFHAPARRHGDLGSVCASSSRSKRSFGVNIRTPEGLTIAKQLITMADVIVENSAHGAMDKIGLGWEDIRAVNPRCVMLSSQLLGDGGGWEAWKGYGPQTRAVGGMTYLWNYPDQPVPIGASYSFPDHYAGRTGFIGALAGLFARARSGRGVHVEAAQVDSILYALSDAVAKEGLEPGTVKPEGNRRARGARGVSTRVPATSAGVSLPAATTPTGRIFVPPSAIRSGLRPRICSRWTAARPGPTAWTNT